MESEVSVHGLACGYMYVVLDPTFNFFNSRILVQFMFTHPAACMLKYVDLYCILNIVSLIHGLVVYSSCANFCVYYNGNCKSGLVISCVINCLRPPFSPEL